MVLPTATAKGHLDQERKNLQSTKIRENPLVNDTSAKDDNQKSHNLYCGLEKIVPTGRAYYDLTGRFPHRSSQGNEYLFVTYHHDSNAILVEPVKKRQASELVRAWEKINATLRQRGENPIKHILDNEMSNNLRKTFFKNKIEFELTPPHMHRRNVAEKSICAFKNHFLASLVTCDPKFPLAEWDRLLRQAELTLNLLRSSRLNPKLSAHAYLFGTFDFNKTPLAPPGTRVVIHDRPENRLSWGFHDTNGWYVAPAPDHY